MSKTLALAAVIGFLLCSGLVSFSQSHHPSSEQRVFGVEDEKFQRPFILPQAILDLLSQDRMVMDSLEEKHIPPAQLPANWFLASEVHLAGPSEKDIVVMGQCPACGANIVPFWVFRPAGSRYELVFFGRGLQLRVRQHRTNGYLDIETSFVAMQEPWTGIWRFDGQRYAVAPTKKHELNHSE